MIKIIRPEQFKTTQWKNGLGETIELAINPGGQMEDFDWRISIATMTESGAFSSFAGYQRHLMLLKGFGLKLEHDQAPSVRLNHLDVTTFDGTNQTIGELITGPVQNFNVMTKQETCAAKVSSHHQSESLDLLIDEELFVYAVNRPLIICMDKESVKLKAGCLAQVSRQYGGVKVSGPAYVLIRISGINDKN